MLLTLACLFLSACSDNSVAEAEKRIEYTQIVEARSDAELLNDLYMASDGDRETLARMLQTTPSTIERIRKGESYPSPAFSERIKEASIFYAQEGQDFTALRSELDPSGRWYHRWFPFIFGADEMEDKYKEAINPAQEELY